VSALTHAKKPTAGTDFTVATSTTTTTTANVSASSVSRQQFPPDQIVSTDDETETDSIASVTNSSSSRTTFSPFSTEVRSGKIDAVILFTGRKTFTNLAKNRRWRHEASKDM